MPFTLAQTDDDGSLQCLLLGSIFKIKY